MDHNIKSNISTIKKSANTIAALTETISTPATATDKHEIVQQQWQQS
jgi:hypothetical protein